MAKVANPYWQTTVANVWTEVVLLLRGPEADLHQNTFHPLHCHCLRMTGTGYADILGTCDLALRIPVQSKKLRRI
jgi:hypothetical protein